MNSKHKKTILIIMSCSAVIISGFLIYFAVMEGVSKTVLKEISGLLSEEEIDEILNDPSLQAVLENENTDLASIDLKNSDLPIKSKVEAVKKVSEDFSMQEIKDISSEIQRGMTAEEQSELIKTITSKFTEEELTALKIIAAQELQKKQ